MNIESAVDMIVVSGLRRGPAPGACESARRGRLSRQRIKIEQRFRFRVGQRRQHRLPHQLGINVGTNWFGRRLPVAFRGDEEKGLVPGDWSADGTTKLVPARLRLTRQKEVLRGERCSFVPFEQT